uniref:Uncharacterized protein n=1 Tax=Salix viminalis TaxID=40686 RepID=A0A6N2N7U2_SALVM
MSKAYGGKKKKKAKKRLRKSKLQSALFLSFTPYKTCIKRAGIEAQKQKLYAVAVDAICDEEYC